MKIAKIVAALGLVAMTVALLYGFSAGDFFAEGGQLVGMPWGVVSLVDLYVGFILFSAWIIYRESSRLRMVVWIALLMTMGRQSLCLSCPASQPGGLVPLLDGQTRAIPSPGLMSGRASISLGRSKISRTQPTISIAVCGLLGSEHIFSPYKLVFLLPSATIRRYV